MQALKKIVNATSSRRYFFFTRAKSDANNGLFKENLMKYKGKRTSQDVAFNVFSSLGDEKIINATSSRRYFFFTRAKSDANNGLFKENLVKYKGKRTSQDVAFIVFSSLKRWFALLLAMLTTLHVFSQDPFFLESRQILSYVNPALTGLNGSLTVRAIHKQQYIKAEGFNSTGINIEQSFPCKNIDVGLYYIHDKEGINLFKTNMVGGSFVYTIPFGPKRFKLHNLRLGMRLQWSQKSIDWQQLIFSDQLDAAYGTTNAVGIMNPTSFVPPDWNNTWQLTLGGGFVHRVEVGMQYKWSLMYGAAFENYTNIGERIDFDSVLDLEQDKNYFVDKYSIYIAPEFPLTRSYGNYFGFKPSYVLQKHANLMTQQIGFEANYQKAFGFGVYFNSGDFKKFTQDTKSLIYHLFFKVSPSRSPHQVNLGVQYMHNMGGLSSAFGQTIQLSLRYNFYKDGCGGRPKSFGSGCPSVSRRHRLMYENIWFTPLEGINK